MNLTPLRDTVSSACRTPSAETLQIQLATIRKLSHASDAAVESVVLDTMHHFRCVNSSVRLNALQIVDYMVCRSRRFRNAIFRDHLQELMSLATPMRGVDPNLPAPEDIADALRERFNHAIEEWMKKFPCAPLRAAHSFYRRSIGKRLSDALSKRLDEEKEKEKREKAQQEKLLSMIQDIPDRLTEMHTELMNVYEQVHGALQLLISGTSVHRIDEMRRIGLKLDLQAVARLLGKSEDDDSPQEDDDDEEEDEEEEGGVDDVIQRYGLGQDYTMSVQVGNGDGDGEGEGQLKDMNAVLLALRDLWKELSRRHLASLLRWEQIITKGSSMVSPVLVSRLSSDIAREKKGVVDTADRLKQVLDESGININDKDKKEEEDGKGGGKGKAFEIDAFGNELVDVPLTGASVVTSTDDRQSGEGKGKGKRTRTVDGNGDGDDDGKATKDTSSAVLSSKSKSAGVGEGEGEGGSQESLEAKRQRLLAIAPKVPSHPSLEYWGETEVIANTGMEVTHRFFGTAAEEAKLDVRQLGLHLRPQRYRPSPEKIRSRTLAARVCRAPLKLDTDGTSDWPVLCSRRDLRRCPFHGDIIDRDEKGRPVNVNDLEKDEEEEVVVDPTPEMSRKHKGYNYNDAVISSLSRSRQSEGNGSGSGMAGAGSEAANELVEAMIKRRRPTPKKKEKLLPLRVPQEKGKKSAKERLAKAIMTKRAREEEQEAIAELQVLGSRKKYHNNWNAPM